MQLGELQNALGQVLEPQHFVGPIPQVIVLKHAELQ
jgi:hypothetical protein